MALVVAETPEQAAFAVSLFDLDYMEQPANLSAHDVIAGTPHRMKRRARSVMAVTILTISSSSTRRSSRIGEVMMSLNLKRQSTLRRDTALR